MQEKRYAVSRSEGAYISAAAAERLIAAGDPGAALFYLYLLRRDAPDSATAAAELGKTEREIEKYAQSLEKLGLLETAPSLASAPAREKERRPAPLPPPEELPEYASRDISARAKEDAGFRTVVEETQRIMGRMLSGADMKILFGIYDYLGMPAEVILLLINHCVTRCRDTQGPGRVPSMRSIEKEAYAWANREIITLDRAEEHLEKLRTRGETLTRLKRVFGIYDRDFTATERKYAESWLDMGFSPEALAIAYDRTVVRKGKRIWPYMDSIIRSWHESGLHTPEEIEGGDAAKPQKNIPAKSTEQSGVSEDVEYLRRLFDELETS